MARVLIPRAGMCSAKVVSASDWELYFGDLIEDYVINGLTVTAQCPNILAVDVSSGTGRLKGLHINNSTTCSVACLTMCATNYIWSTIGRDCMCEPINWSFTKSTTACVPADSMLIGTATTNATTVTSVDNTGKTTHSIIPTGVVLPWGGNYCNPPTGFLLADGSVRDRTVCANLFAVIGTNFGSTMCCNFNLPNLVGKFPRGATSCMNPGSTGGTDAVTLTTCQIPVHTHALNDPGHTHLVAYHTGAACSGATLNATGAMCQASTASATTGITIMCTGGGMCHTNLPSYTEVLYIIKQ